MIVLGMDALGEVPGWLRLGQWTLAHWQPFATQPPAVAASGAAFWSTIGSFAIPTFLLGCLIVQMERQGFRVPEYLGWAILGWMVLAALIIEPSGFPVGVIVAVCLVIGIRRQYRRAVA
jgi:hypothetical protein